LSGLFSQLPSSQVQYDSITAVSGGAVNGVFLASHKVGDEKLAAERMKKFWIDASNADLL
jgi:predicted acylesterase/phospholipase RssA